MRFIQIGILFLLVLACQQQEFNPNNAQLKSEFDSLYQFTQDFPYDSMGVVVIASQKMVAIAHSLDDYAILGKAYKQQAINLGDVGLYEDAIASIYMAIDYYDSSNLDAKHNRIAECYHSLAWFKTYQEDYDQSLILFHKALSLNKKETHQDSLLIANSYQALGSYYNIYGHNLDSGAHYLLGSVKMRLQLRASLDETAQSAVELAENYILSGRFDQSDSIIAALKQLPQSELTQYIHVYFDWLAGLKHHEMGQYAAALQSYQKPYEWAVSAQFLQSSSGINLLRQMVKTCQAGNFYKEGFFYLDTLRQIEQATIYRNRQALTTSLETKLETARKENRISVLDVEVNRKNQILAGMVLVLAVFMVLIFLIFKFYKKVKQRNLQIETLMRELHHRVKNNLQVISSLLGLQSMQLQNEDAKKAVNEGKERIRAMSLIHQRLYSGKETTVLNFKEYIEILVGEIAQSYGYSSKANIRINIPEMSLDVDKSMVSNAFKYAFEDIEEPMLELTMVPTVDNQYCLTISDNGPGVESDFDINQSKSFGLKLVRILTKQIRGKLEVEYNNGLIYSLNFAV
jgi:two-component sensor histidine kinase